MSYNESDLIDLFERAKLHKSKRQNKLAAMKEELTGVFEFVTGKKTRYIHPAIYTVLEQKMASGWFPKFNFEPVQTRGKGKDYYNAKNFKNTFNFVLRDGKIEKEVRKGGMDLFVFGRTFWCLGVDHQSGQATKIKAYNIAWGDCYHTDDFEHFWVFGKLTREEVTERFGEKIAKKAEASGDFKFNPNSDGSNLDWKHKRDQSMNMYYGVCAYYCPRKKVYKVWIGQEEVANLSGAKYPFKRPDGQPFNPISWADAYQFKIDGHPISDIDMIVNSWKEMNNVYKVALMREKDPTRNMLLIGSSKGGADARKEWMKQYANVREGVNIPHFVKLEQTQRLEAKRTDTGNDLSSLQVLRGNFIEDIIMATGVNLLLLGQGAPTAEQENLRLQAEARATSNNVNNNKDTYIEFAYKVGYMMTSIEADFLEKHIEITDQYSEKYKTQGEESTIRDFLESLEDIDFNISIEVNNNNDKQRAVEIDIKTRSLGTIAKFFPEARGTKKLALSLARSQNPYEEFDEEDFGINNNAIPQNLGGDQNNAGQPVQQLPAPNQAQPNQGSGSQAQPAIG